MSPLGSSDLRFHKREPDTSLHCKITDTGLVPCTVCPFTHFA